MVAEHGGLRDFPGVGDGAFGLAGQPDEFLGLAETVRNALGIPYRNIARDYWLTACLHGIARAAGPGGFINKGEGDAQEPLARCAFAGGTSLVSAWDITMRYSEDLDVLALILDERASATARKKPLSVVAKWASDHIGVSKDRIRSEHMSNVGFRRSHMGIGADAEFLKIETTVEDYQDGLVRPCRVFSLMGRQATAEQREQHPELGGFEMPCVTVAYTSANKFDALHRRASQPDYDGLIARGRDLYDLAAIADSEHADEVRAMIPELAMRATQTQGRRLPAPRPRGGYANSILFRKDSRAWQALREGYQQVDQLIWGGLHPFEEALDRAATLDG